MSVPQEPTPSFANQRRSVYESEGFLVLGQISGYLEDIEDTGSPLLIGHFEVPEDHKDAGSEVEVELSPTMFRNPIDAREIGRYVTMSYLHDPFDYEPTFIIDLEPDVPFTPEQQASIDARAAELTKQFEGWGWNV